jgi:hypothetical protein
VIDYNDFPTLEGPQPTQAPKTNYWEEKAKHPKQQQKTPKQSPPKQTVVQDEELTVATSAITTASAEALASLERQMGKQMDVMSFRMSKTEEAFQQMKTGLDQQREIQKAENCSKQQQIDALAISVKALVEAMDRNFQHFLQAAATPLNERNQQRQQATVPVPTFRTDETDNATNNTENNAASRRSTEMGADINNDEEMELKNKETESNTYQQYQGLLTQATTVTENQQQQNTTTGFNEQEATVQQAPRQDAETQQPGTPRLDRRQTAETPKRSNESPQHTVESLEEVTTLLDYKDIETGQDGLTEMEDQSSCKTDETNDSKQSQGTTNSKISASSKRSAVSSKGSSRGRLTSIGQVLRGSIKHQVQAKIKERKDSKKEKRLEQITLGFTRNPGRGRGGGRIGQRGGRGGRGGGILSGWAGRIAQAGRGDENHQNEQAAETQTQLATPEDQPDETTDQQQPGSGTPKEKGPAEE